jgi:putative FmdB family regulatory protein
MPVRQQPVRQQEDRKMPTYEYRCKECGEKLEVVQSFTDDALQDCPACGAAGQLRKVFGSIGITFKGSGFYKTDSRAGSSGTKAETAASSSETKSDAATSPSSPSTDTSSSSSKGEKSSAATTDKSSAA